MRKIYVLFFAASLFLSVNMANAQGQASYHRTNEPAVPLTVVSENGEWACGEFQFNTFTYNTVTNQSTQVTQPGDVVNILSGVSNDGLFVGAYGFDYGSASPHIYKNGTWTLLETLEGYPGGIAMAISPDSKIILGNNAKDIGTFVPVIWRLKEGTYKVERLPFPEKDMLGMDPQGAIAIDMTNDGSVIIGRLTDYTSFYEQPIKWELKSDNTYSYELLGSDVLYNLDKPKPGIVPVFEEWVTAEEGTPEYNKQYAAWKAERNEYDRKMLEFKTPNVFGRGYRLNGNGTHLLTTLKKETEDAEIVVPFCININNNEKTEYLQAAFACAITNSGKIIYSTPYGGICNVSYITSGYGSTEGMLFNEWLKSTYDLNIDEEQTISVGGEEKMITGSITVSKNEKVLIGHFWDESLTSFNNYVVKLPEPISPNSIQENESTPGIKVIANGNTIQIDGDVRSVEVTDIAGKGVYRGKNNNLITHVASGLYVVKAVVANGETIVKKVMVK